MPASCVTYRLPACGIVCSLIFCYFRSTCRQTRDSDRFLHSDTASCSRRYYVCLLSVDSRPNHSHLHLYLLQVSGELEYNTVFAHDWFMGDIPLRVITDNPAMALFVRCTPTVPVRCCRHELNQLYSRNISGATSAPAIAPTDFADEASVIFHSSNVDVLACESCSG